MNCDTARQIWNEMHDGEATPERCASLELHLQSCEACRAYAGEMGEIVAALDDLRVSTDSIGASRAPRRSRLAAWGSLAAAIAVVIGATVVFQSQRRTGEAQSDSASPSPSLAPLGVVDIELTERSSQSYIPVVGESSRANVHLVVLYDASN